jgi:hypothetical protein
LRAETALKRKKESIVLPVFLGLASCGVIGWAVWRDGPEPSFFALLGAISALASLVLLGLALLRRGRGEGSPILVDGSNVLHWRNDQPDLASVRAVLNDLTARGFSPGVIFDANVGYKIGSHYLDDRHLAKMLKLPEDRVLVVPKGTPADGYLLAAARDLGAKVVTNDRFRDWAEAHPEVREPGFLIRGGFRDGRPWLDLDKGRAEAA